MLLISVINAHKTLIQFRMNVLNLKKKNKVHF